MLDSWEPYKQSGNLKWALGVEFYARLFSQHPDLVPFFKGAQMDSLSKHFGQALELVATSFGDMWEVSSGRGGQATAVSMESPSTWVQLRDALQVWRRPPSHLVSLYARFTHVTRVHIPSPTNLVVISKQRTRA